MLQLIWGLIAVLLAYGGWQLVYAIFIGFRRRTALPAENSRTAADDIDSDFFNYAPLPGKDATSGATVTVYSHEQPDIGTRETAKTPLDPFAIELELQRLRMEVNGVREIFEIQQKEIETLRVSLAPPAIARPQGMECRTTTLPQSQSISRPAEPDTSPEYDEALALARRGVMADVIAARCGITRAEADLVTSLASRGRTQAATGGMLS